MSDLFENLSLERLKKMQAAGHVVSECHRVLEKTGSNIVGDILKGCGTFYQMNHYPDGDVYDHETHAQYYYHAHRDGEHGHFHLFLRPKGMKKGIKPARVKDYQKPTDPNEALSHLIAISMDPFGKARSLFTTNRWVTAEYWYKADDVIKMLDDFEIDHAFPSWPSNQWLGAMVQLFYPQICALLRQRDEAIRDWQKAHPDSLVFEDRGLEIASESLCNLDEQIKAVAQEIARREKA